MITITVYFHDRKWRVKRSDKKLSTFTDILFDIVFAVATTWAIQEEARLIVEGFDGVCIGKIDFGRLYITPAVDGEWEFGKNEDVSAADVESELDQMEAELGDRKIKREVNNV